MGAITLVNAIASGKGATVSVELPTTARAEINEERGGWNVFMNGRKQRSSLAMEAIRGSIKICGKDPARYSGSVETTTSAAAGVGLKTSSSSSVAIILAVLSALGVSSYEPEEVARCSASSALAAGVSVTGAMDDAASCLLGGMNFADNSGMKIVSSAPVGRRLPVIITVPPRKSRRASVEVNYVRRFSKISQSIFSLGRQGKIWKAMTLNGLLYCSIYGYPPIDALQAMEGGALGAGLSGTGPAVAAVFEDRKEAEQLARVWEEGGSKVIRTETSDGGATFGN
ncbi:MAG TPA: shikimate kinase [Nitrososphaerales archaeon]|nr:shikimate kinase [Nitrososphaerales archaeon]